MTVNSKEETSEDFCTNYVEEFGLRFVRNGQCSVSGIWMPNQLIDQLIYGGHDFHIKHVVIIQTLPST